MKITVACRELLQKGTYTLDTVPENKLGREQQGNA